ncbi:MAG: hypothetical protein JXC32_01240 [Anaerolineae bacterium]|nr:hypothetical protein [Anaerolineae bacterium]
MRRLLLRLNFARRMNSTYTLVLVVMGLIALLLPHPLLALYGPDGAPDDPRRRFFDETRFWVSGEFLDYFDTRGGLEIFGYPISDPYNENGILVQYFQNARMEWHALNPDPYKVQLGKLGEELGLGRAPDKASLSAGAAYFPETGHAVTYMFLRYFNAHGGVDFFGYPISPMLVENQKVVQYFQCLKLIWDPVLAEMTVGNLGEIYVNAHRDTIPLDVLEPIRPRELYREEPNLQVSVGLAHPVAKFEDGQTVTVVVRDDRLGEPVGAARVKLTVRDDAGNSYPALTQDLVPGTNGRVQAVVPLQAIRPGSWLIFQVEASSGTKTAVAKEAFLVWW